MKRAAVCGPPFFLYGKLFYNGRMIQDIYPHRFDNSFKDIKPEFDDTVMCFDGESLLACYDEEKMELSYPSCQEIGKADAVYIFSIDGKPYFLCQGESSCQGYRPYTMAELRGLMLKENRDIFAAYSAYHLYKWYKANVYCGSCGTKLVHDTVERALICPNCGSHIYPRLNPAVIIAVTNGDRILLTKYNRGFAHNALVAGFTEFGETLEETVMREVKEETGLRVKNIRYYKSQPWGVALDILAGFWCEVDGDDTIHMDDHELKYAAWVKREDIILQPKDYSLTNEMMSRFKMGLEKDQKNDSR